MFELILMRHAKSDWHSHTADIDRPLNERGAADAVRMGARLKQLNLVPDTMVVSSAQRTQETADLLLNNLTVDEEIDLTAIALNTKLEWEADILISGVSIEEDTGSSGGGGFPLYGRCRTRG